MYSQKLYKNGNSVVLTVPKQVLRNQSLRDGSQVNLVETEEGFMTTKRNVNKSLTKPKNVAASNEFKKWLDEALKEDAQILDELAER